MAKGNVKAPVAGQSGYDPFAAEPKTVEQGDTERTVTAIPPKAPKTVQVPVAPLQPAKVAKGGELLAYLIETGTNPQKMAHAQLWLADHPDSTAEQFFRYIEDPDEGHMQIALGTVRKAGKWLWGDTWEPEAAALQSPSEEIMKLRGQLAGAEGQLAAKNAEIAGLKNQQAYLEGRIKELGAENDYLKVGRRPEDIGPGRNALTGATVTG